MWRTEFLLPAKKNASANVLFLSFFCILTKNGKSPADKKSSAGQISRFQLRTRGRIPVRSTVTSAKHELSKINITQKGGAAKVSLLSPRKRMKTLKYWGAFFIIVLLLLIPCAAIFYLSQSNVDIVSLAMDNIPFVCIGGVLYIALFKAANTLFEKSKYEKSADAFGMTNDFDYFKLSDKERKEYDKQRKEEMNRVMPDSTIRKASHPGSKNPETDMQALSGMAGVKKAIERIVARATYDKEHGKKGEGYSSHYVFYGAPGTGKTTFARILTGFLYKNKVIKKNLCIEVDGNLLKASAPGEGAMKAEILVKNAIGGVLFIDEAYSMAEGYGNEAVDTLIKLMEDMRGQFVLILAGYTEPMAKLLSSNPGFRSRIKDYIEFPDYTVEEAAGIFQSMASAAGLRISKECMAKFCERYERELPKADFGNARTVRNILDEAITNHAVRIKKDHKAKQGLLVAADIELETRKII